MRYYKQRFGLSRAVTVAKNQKAVGRVLQQYRALGWTGSTGTREWTAADLPRNALQAGAWGEVASIYLALMDPPYGNLNLSALGFHSHLMYLRQQAQSPVTSNLIFLSQQLSKTAYASLTFSKGYCYQNNYLIMVKG